MAANRPRSPPGSFQTFGRFGPGSFGALALIMLLAALGRLLVRPSLSPSRCRKGFLMYTRTKSLPNLYIRNIIPDDVSIPSSASLAYRGGAKRLVSNDVEEEFCEVHDSKHFSQSAFRRCGWGYAAVRPPIVASACRIRGVDSLQASTGCCIPTS
jgi:hypothetical protein